MKILILNGSPRKNGKISQLLHIAEDEILKSGNLPVFFDVPSLLFKSCLGCMACRTNKICSLKEDDGHRVAKEIESCDGIIVGSPVYWANMSGSLKCLFDRLVGVMMGESKMGIPIALNKGKKAVIITSCTTPFPFNILAGQTTKTEKALKEILHYSGFTIKAKIALAGSKNIKVLPDCVCKRVKKSVKSLIK